MYLPFNEVSLHEKFVQKQQNDIDEKIFHFFLFLRELDKRNILDKLIVYNEFNFNNNELLNRWLKSPTRTKEERSWYYRFIDRHLEEVNKPELDEAFVNVGSLSYSSIGICHAIINKHPGILNIQSDDFWIQKSSKVLHRWLDENCDFLENYIDVNQFFDMEQISDLELLEDSNRLKNISSGQDLWEQWNSFFPNLIPCGDVKENLYARSNKYHLDLVVEKLKILQKYFANKSKAYFYRDLRDLGLDVVDETPSTKKESECEESHTFLLPNGEKDVFWLHIRFDTDVLVRLHFKPKDMNNCYIAHIGFHLKTYTDVRK